MIRSLFSSRISQGEVFTLLFCVVREGGDPEVPADRIRFSTLNAAIHPRPGETGSAALTPTQHANGLISISISAAKSTEYALQMHIMGVGLDGLAFNARYLVFNPLNQL